MNGVTALDVLIDQDAHALALLQHAHRPAQRALPVDDAVARACASARAAGAGPGCRGARHHGIGAASGRAPAPAVPSSRSAPVTNSTPRPCGVRQAHALLAFELDARQHLRRSSVLNFSSSKSRRPKCGRRRGRSRRARPRCGSGNAAATFRSATRRCVGRGRRT